ncbi:putative NAD dependent epimerase/dehydratase [Cadophora sp. DSE1049]|nr:putative NAD dependent epimerase/dehydratase [Cadophora sp. DSE1049]
MSKLIVIVGITGKQGGSVATFFSTVPNWRIRGLTRNPSSPKALHYSSLGIEIMAADLSTPSTLTAAFAGATAIFSTTDFWSPFYDPSTPSLLKEGETVAEYCKVLEKKQVINVADAASKVVGLERLVVSALCHAEEGSGGKYGNVKHWDGKAEGVRYLKERYPKLAEKTTVVVLILFYLLYQKVLRRFKLLTTLLYQAHDGSYRLALVGSGLRPQPHISIAHDLGCIIHCALLAPPKKTILAAGSMLSYTSQLEIWCRVNNIPFGGFDELSIDMFERFFPIPGLGRELGEMMAFMDEFGYAGDWDVVLPEQLGPCPTTSFEEFVKGQDWSKQLNA